MSFLLFLKLSFFLFKKRSSWDSVFSYLASAAEKEAICTVILTTW